PRFIRAMVEKKLLGDKTRGGFYKKTTAGLETLDPRTGEYRAQRTNDQVKSALKPLKGLDDTAAKLRALMADTGPAGQFAWKTVSRTLAYTARRVGEIADDLPAIDDAMKWGYNWELGPFETWDAMGFRATVERMQKDGLALPRWVTAMYGTGA